MKRICQEFCLYFVIDRIFRKSKIRTLSLAATLPVRTHALCIRNDCNMYKGTWQDVLIYFLRLLSIRSTTVSGAMEWRQA